MIDVQRPVPRDVLEGRVDSLQAWARGEGLEAIVVFGQGSVLGTATRSHGNLRYLADWDADAAPSALVVTAKGRASVVVGNVFAAMAGREKGWISDIRLGKGSAFAHHILDLLVGATSSVGIVGRDEIPFAIWSVLAEAGAGGWRDCSGELAARRAIKDEIEIAYHREAARLCDMLFEALGPALHKGRPVFQVQAELEALGRAAGAELCRTWLTVRPLADRCRFWRDENRTIPEPGDQVLLGIMLLLHGHWGHAIRTASLGQPSEAARDVFARVETLHADMLAQLRPGADLRTVGEAGVVRAADGLFQFRSGHALGHSYEDPIGTAEFPQPYEGAPPPTEPLIVQPGMIFEIHPNIFVDGQGGASIGDMVLVRPEGPELLTTFRSDLVVL